LKGAPINSATPSPCIQIASWLIWTFACLVFLLLPECVLSRRFPGNAVAAELLALPGIVTEPQQCAYLFPRRCRYLIRKWVWMRYGAFCWAHQRALWIARVGRLALSGALTMAQVVDC